MYTQRERGSLTHLASPAARSVRMVTDEAREN